MSREGQPPKRSAFGVSMDHLRDRGQVIAAPGGEPLYPWQSINLSKDGAVEVLRLAPDAPRDVTAVLINDVNLAGLQVGASGPSPTVLTALGGCADRLVHLLGHALADLGDEYVATPQTCDLSAGRHANIGIAGAPRGPWA